MTRKKRFRNVGAGKGIKEQLDRVTLRHLYVDLGYTQSAIAKQFGCSPQFVSLLLKEYGVRPTSLPSNQAEKPA